MTGMQFVRVYNKFRCYFCVTKCCYETKNFERFLLHILRHTKPMTCKDLGRDIQDCGSKEAFLRFDDVDKHLEECHDVDLMGRQ